jgi:transposase
MRRIATRYEKRAVNYHAMVTIGMIKLWGGQNTAGIKR